MTVISVHNGIYAKIPLYTGHSINQHIDKLNPDGLPHSEFSHQPLHCLLRNMI